MNRGYGWSAVEWMFCFVVSAALIGGIIALLYNGNGSGDPAQTEQATRDVLPGKVSVVCIEGFEYLYVQSKWEHRSRAGLAPKWDKEGKPSRCRAEK